MAAFLEERIPFGRIAEIIAETMNACPRFAIDEIGDVHAADAQARAVAAEIIGRTSALTNILYILLAILLLGVIVVVHEFGHFLVGRLSGIGVTEFSVGFGPRLLRWRRGETDYSLRAIPIGGFCKFVGEDEENPAPNAMNNAPVWKRICTVAAGPAMNFVLAYAAAVLMLCLFYAGGVQPRIASVVDGAPAQTAELQAGDVVTAVNGTEIAFDDTGVSALRAAVQTGQTVDLTVDRGGETLSLSLTPAAVEENGETVYQIGVMFTTRTYTLGEAIPGAGRYMVQTTKSMLDVLRRLIFKGEGAENMAGTVGTVAVVSEVMRQDSSMALDILFLLSLNIGIMNLLPLPALDGGRLVFLIVEAVRGKPVPPEKEGLVHVIGLIALLALFVVLTFHDIRTFILK